MSFKNTLVRGLQMVRRWWRCSREVNDVESSKKTYRKSFINFSWSFSRSVTISNDPLIRNGSVSKNIPLISPSFRSRNFINSLRLVEGTWRKSGGDLANTTKPHTHTGQLRTRHPPPSSPPKENALHQNLYASKLVLAHWIKQSIKKSVRWPAASTTHGSGCQVATRCCTWCWHQPSA